MRAAGRPQRPALAAGLRERLQALAGCGNCLAQGLSSSPWPGRSRSGRSTPPSGSGRRRRPCARRARDRGSTPGGATRRAAHRRGRAIAGAQWADNGSAVRLAQPADARGSPVMPPQRVDVGLQHVDRPGLEHPAEVAQVVAVLAGRDLHPGRRASRTSAQALEVVGGDRLLEPASRRARRTVAPAPAPACACRRRWRRPSARRRRRSPRAPRATRSGRASGSRPTFILTRGMPASPSRRAARQPVVVVGGEAAAAVDRARRRGAPSSLAQRQSEQPRLQVPQRDVDRARSPSRRRRPAGVAERVAHRAQAAAARQRVAAATTSRERARR